MAAEIAGLIGSEPFGQLGDLVHGEVVTVTVGADGITGRLLALAFRFRRRGEVTAVVQHHMQLPWRQAPAVGDFGRNIDGGGKDGAAAVTPHRCG